ncbi:hypothetical protein [Microbacterium album]|uniref:Uncharacterized protein n=1 Tax=Microbacterium album TaxID=2053191 RepID=A0A917IC96_9MICO|nr:hypothetical protein [Microbacterium album]GGH33953.1 hypothetical protein GCM10010921_01280 [Microbacterium album]
MSVLLDQETVVLEGLDFEPRCEERYSEEHAATHTIICRVCGGAVLACEKHLAHARWLLRDEAKHIPCGSVEQGFDLLFTWRPL